MAQNDLDMQQRMVDLANETRMMIQVFHNQLKDAYSAYESNTYNVQTVMADANV